MKHEKPPRKGGEPLPMWIIYERPSDFPKGYVVRCWHVGATGACPHSDCQTASTLEDARKLIPPGLFNLGRSPNDQPPIKEVWL